MYVCAREVKTVRQSVERKRRVFLQTVKIFGMLIYISFLFGFEVRWGGFCSQKAVESRPRLK